MYSVEPSSLLRFSTGYSGIYVEALLLCWIGLDHKLVKNKTKSALSPSLLSPQHTQFSGPKMETRWRAQVQKMDMAINTVSTTPKSWIEMYYDAL